MKFLQTADLYLDRWGTARLAQLVDIATEKKVDAVLLAGGIWYAPAPSVESVLPFCAAVRQLTSQGIRVFAVGSSRDAALAQLPPMDGFTCVSKFTGAAETVTLEDEKGAVMLYLLPELPTTEKFISVLEQTPLMLGVRSVLLSAQKVEEGFVTAFDELVLGGDSTMYVTELDAPARLRSRVIFPVE